MTGTDQENRSLFHVVRIIAWVMMVAMPAAYLLVAFLVKVDKFAPGDSDQLVVYILLLVAVMLPATIPMIERHQINAVRSKPQTALAAERLFHTLSVIRAALVESTYIFGLVVYLITGDILKMLWFYPIGLLWTLIFWPRRETYKRLAERLGMP